jgi:DNA primase
MTVHELDEFIERCHGVLIEDSSSDSDAARTYLKESRGLTKASVDLHRIGYCPPGASLPEEIRHFGNVRVSKRTDYSFCIQDRIIVPIVSEFGDNVAFATRKPTTEDGYSWWNLPRPFKKGSHLYLLNHARSSIFKEDKVYIVEGYMDALLLYQAGITNVCSLMGTALTLRKIGRIARYCENICFALDVDKNGSGQRAFRKSVAVLARFNFVKNLSVIDGLPVGVDPDDFVNEHGVEAFLALEKTLTPDEIHDVCVKAEEERQFKPADIVEQSNDPNHTPDTMEGS